MTVTTMAQYLGTMRRDALDVSNNVFPLFHLKLSFSKKKFSLKVNWVSDISLMYTS